MASIRERAGTWQIRVWRKGYPDEVASFSTKTEAQKWARRIEAAMNVGTHLLTDVLQRYMEVTHSKRGAKRGARS